MCRVMLAMPGIESKIHFECDDAALRMAELLVRPALPDFDEPQCLPPGHHLAEQPSELYRLMHSVVIELLNDRGVELSPRGYDSRNRTEPFLCFLREASPDLVLHGHKVLGSAQRRRRGAVLQHGSLLLGSSASAHELLGLSELVPAFEWSEHDADQLGRRMGHALGGELTLRELPDSVLAAALKSHNRPNLPSHCSA